MPLVSIEVIKQYSKEEEITLMHAVNSALKSAFKLSDDAINIRLFTHEPHRFFISPTEAKLETMFSTVATHHKLTKHKSYFNTYIAGYELPTFLVLSYHTLHIWKYFS